MSEQKPEPYSAEEIALHVEAPSASYGHAGYCVACLQFWPCATARMREYVESLNAQLNIITGALRAYVDEAIPGYTAEYLHVTLIRSHREQAAIIVTQAAELATACRTMDEMQARIDAAVDSSNRLLESRRAVLADLAKAEARIAELEAEAEELLSPAVVQTNLGLRAERDSLAEQLKAKEAELAVACGIWVQLAVLVGCTSVDGSAELGQVEFLKAEIARKDEALRDMLEWFGRMEREEWTNYDAWLRALNVIEQAKAALKPAPETAGEQRK